MGYIKGNLPRSKSKFNFLTSAVVFCQQKKLFEKNLMKDATDKAVTIILDEKQNFTINSKILIIKHNLYCCILEEGQMIAKEQI